MLPRSYSRLLEFCCLLARALALAAAEATTTTTKPRLCPDSNPGSSALHLLRYTTVIRANQASRPKHATFSTMEPQPNTTKRSPTRKITTTTPGLASFDEHRPRTYRYRSGRFCFPKLIVVTRLDLSTTALRIRAMAWCATSTTSTGLDRG